MTYVVFTPYKNGKVTSPRAVFANKAKAKKDATAIGFKSFIVSNDDLGKYAR